MHWQFSIVASASYRIGVRIGRPEVKRTVFRAWPTRQRSARPVSTLGGSPSVSGARTSFPQVSPGAGIGEVGSLTRYFEAGILQRPNGRSTGQGAASTRRSGV